LLFSSPPKSFGGGLRARIFRLLFLPRRQPRQKSSRFLRLKKIERLLLGYLGKIEIAVTGQYATPSKS